MDADQAVYHSGGFLVHGHDRWNKAYVSAPRTDCGAAAVNAEPTAGEREVGLIHTSTPPEVEPLHRASYCSRVFQRKCPEMAFLSLPLAQHGMQ